MKASGLKPSSKRKPGEPDVDIAWWRDEVLFIAEVKSITVKNEAQQIRLGLGQVLDYVHQAVALRVTEARAVLALERAPSNDRWIGLCRAHGVELVWPETFATLVRDF